MAHVCLWSWHMGRWLKQELKFEASVGSLARLFQREEKRKREGTKGRCSSEKYQREHSGRVVCKVQDGDVAPKQNLGLKCTGAVS